MKIVRNPRRWLKNLFRTAASLSLAATLQPLLAQEQIVAEPAPTGSATQAFGFNRDGTGYFTVGEGSLVQLSSYSAR